MSDIENPERQFDELDAAIAAALRDPSAWLAPDDGFEDRCMARIENDMAGRRAPSRGAFPQMGILRRLAAAVVMLLSFAAGMVCAQFGTRPSAPEVFGIDEEVSVGLASADIGRKCESMTKLLETTVSRRSATEFLASVCLEAGI